LIEASAIFGSYDVSFNELAYDNDDTSMHEQLRYDQQGNRDKEPRVDLDIGQKR